MSTSTDILNMLRRDHTLAQRLNYLKYKFSNKREILNYDPVTISIVATSDCTLSCDMCPTHSSLVGRDYPHIQKNAKDIDFEMFKEMIDRFDNALEVHIIGSGEPLLNKAFFKMADYAAAKKMVVKTFSNGTVIKKDIDRLLNSRLDGITISLNGQDSKEFKRMTGMDERIYSEIYEAVEILVRERDKRSSNLSVKLSFIIDRHNYKFIPKMIDVSLRLGVDHIFFCNFLTAPYDGLRPSERLLVAGDVVKDELNAIFKNYPPEIRKKCTPPILVDEKIIKNNCEIHFSQIRFDGDGNVSSCSMMLLDMSGHGNYKEEGLWNNEFFKTMRRAFLSGDDKCVPSPCKICPDNKGVEIGR